MREVTIQCGCVRVKVDWIDRPCPICRTVVKAGEQHYCSFALTVPQPQTQEASK